MVKMLEREGVASSNSRVFAAQFVAMALGEWQRCLLFGGGPSTDEEMMAQATAPIIDLGLGSRNGAACQIAHRQWVGDLFL